MTNQQAASKAKKRWNGRAYIRAGQDFSSPERRDKNREQYKTARAELEAIEADIKQRLSELDWYQELRTKQRKLRKVADAAQSEALYHRFSVGKSGSMFTEIFGQGDTWEEAFAEADKRAA